jgi:hypothetical protein
MFSVRLGRAAIGMECKIKRLSAQCLANFEPKHGKLQWNADTLVGTNAASAFEHG